MDDKIYHVLLESARKAMCISYSPYSNFAVGAALLTNDDEIITACNVENASIGLSICAERAAIFKAISENHRKFQAIAIVSAKGGTCYPCGACRQVISEFANDSTEVVLESDIEGEVHVIKFSELLPHAFGSRDLDTQYQN